jgi:hypothetical protein
MKELYVFCEGPTEQGFCNQVLAPHLFLHHDGCIHTIKIAHSKHHGETHRGGIGKYAALKRDIQNTLKSRDPRNVYFTTMIDLYGLPLDFPGKEANVRNPANPTPYVLALEKAFGDDINHYHFIPYLQLHEYETLLFSGPEAFAVSFDNCHNEIQQLKEIAASVSSIEYIDDGKDSAPSKRIIAIIPEYEGRKVSAGPDIAEFIGIGPIRAHCPHFHDWLIRLESLLWEKDLG